MGIIETKYSIGEKVWQAGIETTEKKHPCPDCLGAGKWTVTSPAGHSYDFRCPRCAASYTSYNNMCLKYAAHVGYVQARTIGSIQHNTAPNSYDSGTRYMCLETGIGSGSVYNEDKLFPTQEEAQAAADAMAEEANSKIEWVVKQYDCALEISDYQLDNALIKEAKDAKLKASSLLYNLSDLFETINEAEDKDAILDAITEYRAHDWERDKARVSQAD